MHAMLGLVLNGRSGKSGATAPSLVEMVELFRLTLNRLVNVTY